MKGVNPAWANLPRRKCDDCGKNYKPKQPLRPGKRGFCSDNCRKSYHKHGGAYRKLRVEVQKLIERMFQKYVATPGTLDAPAVLSHLSRIDARLSALELKAASQLPNPQRRG